MAWYKTGTISVNQNSTSVTGSSTYFVENAKAGYIFIAADGKLYEIASIVDNTHFELVSPYLGTTLVNATYQIIPTHGLVRDLANNVQTLISDFTDIGQKAGAGKFQQGSAIAPGITFELDTNTGIYQPTDNNINIVANGVDALSANEVDTSLLAAGLIKLSTKSTGVEVFGTAETDVLKLKGGTGTQGEVSWNTDEETLDVIQNGATLQLGQETQWHCRNNTGAPISDGVPVMATGTLGASGRITIAPMDGTDIANAKYYLGITTEPIGAGEDGKVTAFGKVRGLNTSVWNEGDVLYISTTTIGGFQNTEPTSGLNMPVAFVVSKHQSVGTLAVRSNNANMDVGHKSHNETISGVWNFSNGIYLGGTTVANQLDDYETGTFTPSVIFGGASTGITYTSRAGSYTKVGNLVFISVYVNVSNKGSATGNFEITDLPFSAINASDCGGGAANYYTGFTLLGSVPFVRATSNKIEVRHDTSSSAGRVVDSNCATAFDFRFSVVYEIS